MRGNENPESRAPWPLKKDEAELEKLEIELLLEGMYRCYGYDFRSYAYASLRRRIWHRIYGERLQTISGLQERILHDRDCMERLAADLVIHVTEMFRDPALFALIRERVVPLLRDIPGQLRIWHAGCATGEEVYSMAILLYEEGLYDRVTFYATDVGGSALQQAERRTYPLRKMQDYTKNYMQAGGKDAFSRYYSTTKDTAKLHSFLRERIVFAEHNLVTDRPFHQVHMIFCRNVLIYFNSALQRQAHEVLYESLLPSGFLVLGDKETITLTEHADCYEALDTQQKLYCKIK